MKHLRIWTFDSKPVTTCPGLPYIVHVTNKLNLIKGAESIGWIRSIAGYWFWLQVLIHLTNFFTAVSFNLLKTTVKEKPKKPINAKCIVLTLETARRPVPV